MRVRSSTSVHQDNRAFHGMFATDEQIRELRTPRERQILFLCSCCSGGFGLKAAVSVKALPQRPFESVTGLATASAFFCARKALLIAMLDPFHTMSSSSCRYSPPPTPDPPEVPKRGSNPNLRNPEQKVVPEKPGGTDL